MSSSVNFSLESAAATAAAGPVSHRIAPAADTRAPEVPACEAAREIVAEVTNTRGLSIISQYLGVNPFSAPVPLIRRCARLFMFRWQKVYWSFNKWRTYRCSRNCGRQRVCL